MKTLQQWIQESSLRDQLQVPQKPLHHPEGPVDRHTMMVHTSLQPAIKALQQKQKDDPQGPLSNLDLNFTSEEINILRLAGLLHDIGKGDALDPETLSAHGHEDPETFEKAMQRLGPIWHQMHDKANPQDKQDLWWVIKYHMSLKDKEGFQNKALKKELLDDQGKYKNDRRIKLLLVLLLMDRMGRGGEAGVPWQQAKQFAQSNVDSAQKGLEGIYTTSDLYQKELAKKSAKSSQPIGDDPQTAVASLKQRGKTPEQIRMALQGMVKSGKFQLSPEEINALVQESTQGTTMKFKNFVKNRDHIEEALDQAKLDLAVQQGKVTPQKAKDVAQSNKEVEDHLNTMEVAKKVKMYLQPNMIDWLHTRNIDFRHDERPNERINIQKFSGRIDHIVKVLEDFTNQKRLWPGAYSMLGNDMDRNGGAFGNLFHFLSSLEKQPKPDEHQSSKSHFIDKEVVQPLQRLSTALTNYNKMVSETHPELFSHTGMLNYRAMNPNQRVMFKQPPAAPAANPFPAQPTAPEQSFEPESAPESPIKAKKSLWGTLFGR